MNVHRLICIWAVTYGMLEPSVNEVECVILCPGYVNICVRVCVCGVCAYVRELGNAYNLMYIVCMHV